MNEKNSMKTHTGHHEHSFNDKPIGNANASKHVLAMMCDAVTCILGCQPYTVCFSCSSC